jgi:DNA polymerase-1
MYLLLGPHPSGAVLQELTQTGHPHPANPEPRPVSANELADVVLGLERRPRGGQPPRWIWHRTQYWYPSLLARGVELERCYDLSLCGNILALSQFAAHTDYARNAEKITFDDPQQPPPPPPEQDALFDNPHSASEPRLSLEDLRAEYVSQQEALAAVGMEENRRHRLQLLLAAESAGAMIAAEMQHTGVPLAGGPARRNPGRLPRPAPAPGPPPGKT